MVSFNPKNTFNAEKIIQYGNQNGDWSDYKPNDTLQINGEWKFDEQNINLKSEFEELNGTFKVNEFDYEYMLWTKTIEDN